MLNRMASIIAWFGAVGAACGMGAVSATTIYQHFAQNAAISNTSNDATDIIKRQFNDKITSMSRSIGRRCNHYYSANPSILLDAIDQMFKYLEISRKNGRGNNWIGLTDGGVNEFFKAYRDNLNVLNPLITQCIAYLNDNNKYENINGNNLLENIKSYLRHENVYEALLQCFYSNLPQQCTFAAEDFFNVYLLLVSRTKMDSAMRCNASANESGILKNKIKRVIQKYNYKGLTKGLNKIGLDEEKALDIITNNKSLRELFNNKFWKHRVTAAEKPRKVEKHSCAETVTTINRLSTIAQQDSKILRLKQFIGNYEFLIDNSNIKDLKQGDTIQIDQTKIHNIIQQGWKNEKQLLDYLGNLKRDANVIGSTLYEYMLNKIADAQKEIEQIEKLQLTRLAKCITDKLPQLNS